MEPTKELIDALFLDKVRQARAMTVRQRLESVGELFEFACEVSRCGIRDQHPEWDEEQVEAELSRRLDLVRRLETQA